jgi:hypothetical protein
MTATHPLGAEVEHLRVPHGLVSRDDVVGSLES